LRRSTRDLVATVYNGRDGGKFGMKTSFAVLLALMASLSVRADFSYTATTKSTGGMMGAAAAALGGRAPGASAIDRSTRHLFKGDKMKLDSGDSATIIDLNAQTMTHIDHTHKTYSVTPFSELGAKTAASGADIKVDIQETDQRKIIDGHNARLFVMTMDVDSPQMKTPGPGGKMRMTNDLWVASDVAGAQELRAFYMKNAARFPWTSMMAGRAASNPGVSSAMAEIQRKMATINGVPVLTVMKMSSPGMGADPRMAEARAKMEEMQKAGGPQAQMAAEMLAKMGGGSGPLVEITTQSSNFSGASIPASEFDIPAGYQKTEK
jgi:hypothetical protein